jgi:GxxExxY protein
MYNDSAPRSRDGYRGPRSGRDEYESRERRGVPLSELDPALTEVSRKVIGCSIEVHKNLGPGFDEKVYLGALCHELDQLGVRYKAGHAFAVMYKGKKVGEHPADLFVDDRFIVEVLADPREIHSLDRANLRAQLRASDLELGLIINFAERRLKDGLVRVLNPEKIPSLRGVDGVDDGHDSGADIERPA